MYCAQSCKEIWKNTASFTGINRRILLDLGGLKDDILAMLAGRADELAGYIDLAHEAYTSSKNYNDENALYSMLYMTLMIDPLILPFARSEKNAMTGNCQDMRIKSCLSGSTITEILKNMSAA